MISRDNKNSALGFWADLPSHFSVLAPMEDVTDTALRQLLIKHGRPDVFFTEFTNVGGMSSEEGRENVMHRLKYTEQERPLVAQIWGKDPENYYKGTKDVVEMGFDGVDINMGCPVKKIIKQGCCSALINNPSLASEILDAVNDAAGDMPVSVKTRIGFDKIVTERWAELLLSKDLAALTIHGRLALEQSTKPADWDEVAKVVKMRNKAELKTMIIGNGDIQSMQDGIFHCEKYGTDGYMIGRGIFKDPWIFDSKIQWSETSPEMRINMLIEHLRLYGEVWEEGKNFNNMKKFYKMYIRDFADAPKIRAEMMLIEDAAAVIKYLEELKVDIS